MDILFEIVFEIIFVGAFEIASETDRRVPLPLRILCLLLVIAVFGGTVFLMIFFGVKCLIDGETGLAVFLLAVGAFFIVALAWKFVKISRKGRR